MSVSVTNNQAIFLGVTWALFGLTLLVCSARFYTRFIMTRSPGADDYLMLITMTVSTGMVVGLTVETRFTLGRHIWNITADDFAQSVKIYYAVVFCFVMSIALAKIAILLQFIKIFQHFNVFLWFCRVMIILIILWATLTILAHVRFCTLTDYDRWKIQAFGSQCRTTIWTIHGVVGIATDLLLVVLPIPIVWQMHLLQKQKAMVCVLLAVGSAGSIVSIIRIISVRRPVSKTDPSYDMIWSLLWFTIECLMAVICGALMACKPLLLLWFPSLRPDKDVGPPPIDLNSYSSELRPIAQGKDGSKQDIWCVALDIENQAWYCQALQNNMDGRTETFLQEGFNSYVRERQDSGVEI